MAEQSVLERRKAANAVLGAAAGDKMNAPFRQSDAELEPREALLHRALLPQPRKKQKRFASSAKHKSS